MVLDGSIPGASRLSDFVDEDTSKLCYMLLMPLFDGVFATMLVSGYLDTIAGMINVAFTVFAGAGALTVVYSEAGTVRKARIMVLKTAPFIVLGSVLTGFVAPAFCSLLNLELLKTVSGAAVALIALQVAGFRGVDKVPVPLVIALGLMASIQPGAQLVFTLEYILPSVLTVSTALIGLYIASGIENRITVRYMRRGGALVLLMISASLLGFGVPPEASFAVLVGSLAASIRF